MHISTSMKFAKLMESAAVSSFKSGLLKRNTGCDFVFFGWVLGSTPEFQNF